MWPEVEARRRAESVKGGFERRDLLVGRPEGAERRPPASSEQAPSPPALPQPDAHEDAVGEIFATV